MECNNKYSELVFMRERALPGPYLDQVHQYGSHESRIDFYLKANLPQLAESNIP
jgi:hypothetical protein